MVNFVSDWLRDKQAVVIFNGSASDPFPLSNSGDSAWPTVVEH